MTERLIKGELILPPGVSLEPADIHLQVRDVSLADASSVVVAERVLAAQDLRGRRRVSFSLSVPEADPRSSLALWVHVDVTRSGSITAGDLLTTVSVPVPPVGAYGASIEAPLTVI